MKLLLIAALLALTQIATAETRPTPRRGTADDVIVARLPGVIPEPPQEAWQFIWDQFSQRPETSQFLFYSTKVWRKNYTLFSDSLIAKAKAQHYEHEALQRALAQVLVEKIAQESQEIGYLPIGAYRTSRGKQEVWVIFCLWEYALDPKAQKLDIAPPVQVENAEAAPKPSRPPLNTEWTTVGHIRIFSYDIQTGELAGFVTCD